MCTNQPNDQGPVFKLTTRAASAIGGLIAMCQPKPHDPDRPPGLSHWIFHKPVDPPDRGSRVEGSGLGDLLRMAPIAAAVIAACATGPNANEDNHGAPRDIRLGDAPPPRPARGAEWWKATALRSEGAGFLRRGDLAGWYRWVFLDLDRHAADCKWAATLRRLRLA